MSDDKKPEPKLTKDQVVELLQVAATYDRRTIGDTDVVAWAHAANHGRWAVHVREVGSPPMWSNHVAVEAIRHHYATSTAYLMPGHITDYVRNWRRDVPTAAAQLNPAAPASEETRRKAMDEMFGRYAETFEPPEDVA